MLQRIRDNASGPLAYVVVAVITVVFGVWGIGSYFTPSSDPVVASVGGTDITRYQLQQSYNQRYQRLRQAMGDNFDADMFPPEQLRRTVLQGLINEAVLTQYANEAGYRVTDARLLAALRSDEQFQVDGQFSPERYRSLLSQAGIPAGRYEGRLREDLKSQQLRRDVTTSAFASPASVDQAYRLVNQERRVRYLAYDATRYVEDVDVSDAELASYYEDHAEQFQRPERVKLSYVSLSRSNAAAGDAAPDEAALRELYEQNAAQFGEPERRSGMQVRVPIEGDGGAARDRIQKLASSAQDGDLEATAESVDSAEYSRIESAARDDLPGAVAEALFELESSETSSPVRGEQAWYLLRLGDVTEAKTPSFDDPDVQSQLKAIASAQSEATAYSDKSDRMETLAYEAPNDLETLADELNLEIQETGWVTREGGDGIGQYDAIRKAAFSDSVLQDELNSTPIQLGSDRRLVLRVESHEAAERQPLDEVRDTVRERVARQKAEDRARDAAREAMSALEAGEPLESLAGENGSTLESPGFIRRSDRGVDPRVREAAFSLPSPENDTRRLDVTATADDRVALVVVDGVRAADDGDSATPREQFADQQRQYVARQEYAALNAYLRNQADVEINENRID